MTNRTRPLNDDEREIVIRNQGLIDVVIQKHFRRYLDSKQSEGDTLISYRELFRAGQFGLIEALDRWDREKGAFTTCAAFWVRNKIGRWLKENAFRHLRVPKWLAHHVGVGRKEAEAAVAAGKITERDARTLLRMDSAVDRVRYAEVLGIVDEVEAKKRLANIARRDKAMTHMPLNEDLDSAVEPEGEGRSKRRRELISLLYSVTGLDDEARLGRVIAMKLAALDGGTGVGGHAMEDVESIAVGLGVPPKRAKKAYDGFLARLREEVERRGITCPLDPEE